jgi:hypothetical protein
MSQVLRPRRRQCACRVRSRSRIPRKRCTTLTRRQGEPKRRRSAAARQQTRCGEKLADAPSQPLRRTTHSGCIPEHWHTPSSAQDLWLCGDRFSRVKVRASRVRVLSPPNTATAMRTQITAPATDSSANSTPRAKYQGPPRVNEKTLMDKKTMSTPSRINRFPTTTAIHARLQPTRRRSEPASKPPSPVQNTTSSNVRKVRLFYPIRSGVIAEHWHSRGSSDPVAQPANE